MAALGQDQPLPIHRQVGNQLTGFEICNDGAHGHAQDNVFCGRTITIRALAVLTATGPVQTGIAIVNQGIDIAISNGNDRAAAAAVPAAWAALGNKFLAAKRHNAIAAITGMDFNRGFVDKFHLIGRALGKRGSMGL